MTYLNNIEQYNKDLLEWKRRNNIPEDAEGVGEKPVYHQGEDLTEFANKTSKWIKERNLWKTAPKLEDYITLEDCFNEIERVKRENTQTDKETVHRLSWVKEYPEALIAFVLLVLLMTIDSFLDRFDWLNIIFYPFLGAIIFVLLHGFVMPLLYWFFKTYKDNEHNTIGNIINISIAMLILAFVGIPKEETAIQKHEEGISVYICTGPQSRAYHMIPDCEWLDNCSAEVIEIDVREAIKRGRHECRLCCD